MLVVNGRFVHPISDTNVWVYKGALLATTTPHLTIRTSHADGTTICPALQAAASACGDAIVTLVGDMICTQLPPSACVASVSSARQRFSLYSES